MRLHANVNDGRRKISLTSSYIAYIGLAGADLLSVRNYDEVRDPQGNVYLRTKAQLHWDAERIVAYLPPHDDVEDRT